jgi:hypothetical protein
VVELETMIPEPCLGFFPPGLGVRVRPHADSVWAGAEGRVVYGLLYRGRPEVVVKFELRPSRVAQMAFDAGELEVRLRDASAPDGWRWGVPMVL